MTWRRAAVLILVLVATACTGRTPRIVDTTEAPVPRATGQAPVGPGLGAIQREPGASLTAVDGSGPSDVWAVGERHGPSIREQSLVAHWDGTSWTLVSVPDVGRLAAIAVSAPTDVWALGDRDLLHWDGIAWSTMRLPRGEYSALSATGPTDVCVAGVQPGPMIGRNTRGWSSAVARFDGTGWTVMHTPDPGSRDNYLEGIVARSQTDVWAGGYFVNLGRHVPEATTLIMHWDGSTWSLAHSPDPSPSLDVLWSMGLDESGRVWGLGHYRASDRHLHALVLRWTGNRWTTVSIRGTSLWSAQAVDGSISGPTWLVGSPATSSFAIARCSGATCDTIVGPTGSGSASSVYSASADDAWAVGEASGERTTPLVEHWDGTAWTAVRFPRFSSGA